MIISRVLLRKMTFPPIKFLCEKKDGHSKRERKELINLHLKRVFQDDITKTRHQFLK